MQRFGPQFGLVAEQVEKVDPDLIARDNEGKPYTVRFPVCPIPSLISSGDFSINVYRAR